MAGSKSKKTAARKAPAKQQTSGIQIPALKKGEQHRGILVDKNGRPECHVILLPGELERATHAEAIEFAKKAGGELPTRRDGALLYANNHGDFQSAWYWLAEQPAGDEGYAWCQSFGNGNQSWNHVSSHYRARAVRRVPIQ